MEINEGGLQTIAEKLQQTLSPDAETRREAEKFLQSLEGTANYSLILLHLVDAQNFAIHLRVASAITFKNFIKRNWRIIEDEPNRINEHDRAHVKSLIIDLMLRSPEQIQKQLSDAISIIGREDFPGKWPDLLVEMVKKMSDGDFHIINGVLRTGHSIFKRYRHEFKSNELWLEIKHVLKNFADPLTNLFNHIINWIGENANNPTNLKVLCSSMLFICKIFYSLNFQDLPEYFEDHMEEWMKGFLVLITSENKILEDEDSEEPSPFEYIKSQVCDNVALYAQKYDEEFHTYLPEFVKAIWSLLISTDNNSKHDLLVSNAIQFMASVSERPHYKHLFEEQSILQSFCEKIIVPNMEFRDADEELFEDSPEQYIRRDIEGSDIDTRRRAACDLVKGLCKHFEGPVTAILSHYVNVMLEIYSKDPENNWKTKDAAIFLVTSLASKKQTAKHGITQSSDLVNIVDFFTSYVLPELQTKSVDQQPVLKADAIKYIMTFRSVLPRDVTVSVIPQLINHLAAKSCVVHSYAAHCLERIFTLKNPGGGGPITKAEVQPCVEALLTNLLNALHLPGSAENEYIMKAIMRSFSLMQEVIMPYVASLVSELTLRLKAVSKNPSKPQFNHYLFEAICVCIKAVCKVNLSAVSSFEEALFPTFQEILKNDVSEFLPYVFQVLSLLLEMREDGIPQSYMCLFPLLVAPVLWERTGNIPPMVRLLQAFISKGAKEIVADQKVTALLGVFQKLVASKLNDHEGFYLLSSMVEHIEPSALNDHMKQVFILLFQRLQSSKTTKYVKGLLVFFCLYAVKNGGKALIDLIDSVQAGIFGMFLAKVIIPDIQKVSGQFERKICAVGLTKVLVECPQMLTAYEENWTPLLQVLIGVFELPEDESVPDDEHFIEIDDTPGYQTAYSQLVFAGKKENDPLRGAIPDPKLFLAQSLQHLSQQHPGKIKARVTGGLTPEALKFLESYLHLAGVALS